MIDLELNFEESLNRGTSWTNNKQFDRDGYLKVENLYDSKELFCDVPTLRGMLDYFDNKNKDIFRHEDVEKQVNGSVSRYNYPKYRRMHTIIRKKLESIVGRELYPTYFLDRFYFSGQKLDRHMDREPCEISVSIHVGTNLPDKLKKWPFKIKSLDVKDGDRIIRGEERSVSLNPGDGVIYKGCECPHWRDPMPSPKNKLSLGKKHKEYYYHQIFFHYVLADGLRCQFAWDSSNGSGNGILIGG
tara:strand:+ start:3313 stop:4044 length:732 start_codon:yes stop_codon:yes gene_type:complete